MRSSNEVFKTTLLLEQLLTYARSQDNETLLGWLEEVKANVSIVVSELLELEGKIERIDTEKRYKLNGKVAGKKAE